MGRTVITLYHRQVIGANGRAVAGHCDGRKRVTLPGTSRRMERNYSRGFPTDLGDLALLDNDARKTFATNPS